MRRTLGPRLALAALLTLGLAACGDDTGEATDPATQSSAAESTPSPTSTPESGDDGPVGFTRIALLTDTEEGGTVSTTPVPLDSDAAVEEFVSQFTGDLMADDVRAAMSGLPEIGDDQTVVGAVVAIGCDRPTDLVVERVDGAVEVRAEVPKNQVQCFAAQTSVAILVLDTTKLGPIVS